MLDAFDDFDYPNEIGPGVYDIHSPRHPDGGRDGGPADERPPSASRPNGSG
ncbi:MAG: hypothetical protein U5L11_16695 [Arhodomonas sp.]|nr:hypothetical protein [Arhodomonas sp.]